jgi:hypothetical protein
LLALKWIVTNLNAHGILDSKLSTLSNLMQESFIKLLLTGEYSATGDTSLKVQKQSSVQSSENVFEYLRILVTYISTRFDQTIFPYLRETFFPALTTDIITEFLPSRIPNSLDDLPAFDILLDAVTVYDLHLVNLGWAPSSPLATWVFNAPETWFKHRLDTFIHETRTYISEHRRPETVEISNGIDIMNESHILGDQSKTEKGLTEVEDTKSTIQQSKDDDEDDTDGWGFDTEETEIDNVPNEVEDPAVDSWKWDDEPEHLNETTKDLGVFPYTVSVIPDGLVEIIQRVLDERELLQSERLVSFWNLSYIRYSAHAIARSVGNYPMIISFILMTWRAIASLEMVDMPSDQKMRLSNDALYLARRLTLNSSIIDMSNEMQHLSRWSTHYMREEMV